MAKSGIILDGKELLDCEVTLLDDFERFHAFAETQKVIMKNADSTAEEKAFGITVLGIGLKF